MADTEGSDREVENDGEKGKQASLVSGRLSKFFAMVGDFKPNLSGMLRLAVTVLAVVVAAVVFLWMVDKVVFFYLAQTYVDEVAKVLDLNPHLANALVLFTFIAAVGFGRYLWSLSRRRRMIGVGGLAALLIGHSLVLWYGTKDQPFDTSGNPIKCYVLTRDGQVVYREHAGIDPSTGRECRPVTPEMYERLQKYASGNRPTLVVASAPIFFDPRSGEPIIWYYITNDQIIQLYDLMGFQPDTGEELKPVTKDIVAKWQKQEEERTRRGPRRIEHPEDFVFFDPRTGEPRAWYWLSAGGHYEFYDGSGFQSQTGDKLQVATRKIVDDFQNQRKNPATPNRPPSKVEISKSTLFFDPVSGKPLLWYWRRDTADYDFFDGPGFDPQNGQPLQSFTKDALDQYQKEIDDKAKQIKAEQDRRDAQQKAEQEAEAKKQLEQQQQADAEAKKRADEAQRRSQAASQCDGLAANPSDAHRVGPGVAYGDLKPQAAAAVDACELASKENPNELRFQYQLARALELLGDGAERTKNRQRAMLIHQTLVSARYAAAFDNLASLYRWDRKDLATAVALFRKGVQVNDSDSMLSLADLIESGQVTPQNPQETPLELYRRAAELGNPNGARAYQDELEKVQQNQQRQVQQLEQQRLMLEFMGNVLRNVH